jgi:hypothetical protein
MIVVALILFMLVSIVLACGGAFLVGLGRTDRNKMMERFGWVLVLFGMSAVWITLDGIRTARGADLPAIIMLGRTGPAYRPSPLGGFGTYSNQYLHRRWARMCKGPARYDAMREAHYLGKAMPCR